MSSRPLVEIRNLTVRAEGVTLLDGVSMDIDAGSIHVLVGPNGAGKSTLLAALLGQRPFAGRIRLHWTGSGRIGYVPQIFHADRTLPLTVTEFLALSRQRWPVCLGVHASTRHSIEALLESVGMAAVGARQLGALSGGELRRTLIANAIDPPPELLICDEPASGLDPAAVAMLDEKLLALRATAGTTIFLVSHDVQQVRRVGDRVTLLDGTVLRSGGAEEVLSAPALSTLPFDGGTVR